MVELLKNIPLLLTYFVPGYIAQSVFGRLTRRNTGQKHSESREIALCIAISFVTTSIAQLLLPERTTVITSAISVGIAVGASLLISYLWSAKWFNKLFIHLTRTALSRSLWDEVLGDRAEKQVRFYTEFNHEKASIEGIVKYYEVDNNHCCIGLSGYTVIYKEGEKRKYVAPENATLVFETNDINNLEVFDGIEWQLKKRVNKEGGTHSAEMSINVHNT